MVIWLGDRSGGAVVDDDAARVPVADHGFTVGDGVFETLKVDAGVPFALTRHLRRLATSALALGLSAPSTPVVRSAIDEVLASSDLDGPGRLRITYTSGSGPMGSGRGDATPTLVVVLVPASLWPATTTVATVPWTRNERSALAGVKSTSYAENVIALQDAHQRGASEALFANTRGELCEGTGSNVFVVRDGAVLTPPLSSGCLAGVTRELVLEWFGGSEEPIPMEALHEADEVFLTSSTRDVHPVVRVDERELAVGAVTTELRAAFAERAALDVDP